MDRRSHPAQFVKRFAGESSMCESASEKTPEQFLHMILSVFFRPGWRLRSLGGEGLDHNQFSATDLFESKGGEVIGYIRMFRSLYGAGGIQQRAGVIDARAHRCNCLLIDLSPFCPAHADNLARRQGNDIGFQPA
jgi:hypothetical protein